MYHQNRAINITIYGTEVGNGFITWDGIFIPKSSIYPYQQNSNANYYYPNEQRSTSNLYNPYKCCIYRLKTDGTQLDYQCHYAEDKCPQPLNRDWEFYGEHPVSNCHDCRR
ncbi:MAG: hypothetical protein M3043_01250 [Lysinibacillus fusiformis]|nr:hypothetical protein [Lysinibacillus fusiformis]MCT6922069.1 hypothetical protein [Staphylococcus epidermidis]MCT6933648.1 hypothetical protein [Lysinibacillus fusiformis]